MNSKRKILFVGGGTGGHFYPLIAIAEVLLDTTKGEGVPTLYYMGPDKFDANALSEVGITFLSCPAGKRRRYRSILNLLDLFKTAFGLFIATAKLFWIYPDVVMSKGGYTSVPVVIAAWILRIPLIVHESDAVAGSANKFAAHFAHTIAITYTDSAGVFPQEKTILTGIPVRRVLLEPMREDVHAMIGIDPGRPTLLILGGSQGAERVNTLVIDSLDELLPHYNIIHQTGKRSFEDIKSSITQFVENTELLRHYHPVAFLDANILNQAYHVASLIISRAGSGIIYEIALHRKPSIVIPIPGSISHDQRTNAYAYARTGAATVMEEENLEDGLLESEIARIMNDQQMYAGMSEAAGSFAQNDAAGRLAELIIQISDEHS